MTDVITQPAAPENSSRARRAADRAPVNSPDALDTVARTTTTRGWIALVAVAIVVAATVVWAFTGTIPQQIQTSGVLTAAGGTSTVVAGHDGSIRLAVAAGATVAKGATVATIEPYDGSAAVPVVAPVAGRVQDLLVSDGQGVIPSDPVLVLVPTADEVVNDRVVTYLPASQATDFDAGADVRVLVVNPAQRAPVGMDAKVVSVAEVPSSAAAIRATLGSEELANEVLENGDGVGYRIDLQLEGVADLPDELRPIPGQIVDISNTYARPHPIQLLFGNGS